MKIAIVYGWSDDNKGDSAIVSGSITLLRNAFPEAHFTLIPLDQSLGQKDYRHLLRAFPGILEIASTSYPEMKKPKFRYLRLVASSWFSLLPRPFQSDLEAIASADLVVCKGGHILHTDVYKSHMSATAAMLQYAYFPIAAFRYNKPVIFLGHSLGPFWGAVDRYLASFVLKRSNMVFVREPISAQVARQLGVPEDKLKVIPDMAFAIEPRYTPAVHSILQDYGLEKSNFAVMTIRSWHNERLQLRFMQEMANLVRYLLRDGHVEKVALVAHTIGPTPIEDDRLASRELFRLVEGHDVVLIEQDLSPEEMVALYGKAQLLVGTRFHSVIFASIAGVPAYSIAYAGPKAEGIMKMLGAEDLVQHISTFSAKKAIEDITSEKMARWKAQVKDKVAVLRRQLEDLVPFLRGLVEGKRND